MLRLKQARIERNISQKDLARALGIGISSLSQYENGQRQPGYETILKIANYFDVTTDYLLGRKESKSPGMDESIPRDDGERKLIQIVRKLDPAQKALLLRLVETAVENSERPQNP